MQKAAWKPLRSVSCALLAVGSLVCGNASAFENQWQLALSGGAATATQPALGWGPSVGLHAAYGMSDSFDAELFTQAFMLPRSTANAADWRAGLVTAGVAYKLDVIQWVPRLGLNTGYYLANGDVSGPPGVRLPDAGLLIGVAPGLDYAWSRSWGLGISGHFESIVARSVVPSLLSVQLSAEYRWGW